MSYFGKRNFKKCGLNTVSVLPISVSPNGRETRSIGINWGNDYKAAFRAVSDCPITTTTSELKPTMESAQKNLLNMAGSTACVGCTIVNAAVTYQD